MNVTYDEEADAAYISLVTISDGEAVAQRVVVVPDRGEVILDFDGDDRLLGVEIIGALKVLSPRFFSTD